jgi:glycerate 2-kinase
MQPHQFTTYSLQNFPRGEDISRILAEAVASVDAGFVINRHLSIHGNRLVVGNSLYNLDDYERVVILGVGKACVPMAEGVIYQLRDWASSTFLITKDEHLSSTFSPDQKVRIIEAGHPIPDQRNLEAGKHLYSLVRTVTKDDLVIVLLSGGGSALLMNPPEGISLADIQAVTSLLLKCGADIQELNSVRKHLDLFKGGGLAKLLFPSTIITLILSDVLGDHLDAIASGPTTFDRSTFTDAWSVVNKYQLLDQLPHPVVTYLRDGLKGKVPETIKPGDPVLDHVYNVIVGNNQQAVQGAMEKARSMGFKVLEWHEPLRGEASMAGHSFVKKARGIINQRSSIAKPACMVAGGETTVTVSGDGIGGRNQEFALACVEELSGADQMVVVSLATDGTDGPTDAAGAVATNGSYTRGMEKGLIPRDYLTRNDSYQYFDQLRDLIKTGPTLTNVCDLAFFFAF